MLNFGVWKMKKKQMRTTCLIDNDSPPLDDWAFIKANGLKPTALLRAKIKEVRANKEGAPDSESLLKSNKALQKQIEKLFSFIDRKGLFDIYIQEENKKV